jgi:hypothetical protein
VKRHVARLVVTRALWQLWAWVRLHVGGNFSGFNGVAFVLLLVGGVPSTAKHLW